MPDLRVTATDLAQLIYARPTPVEMWLLDKLAKQKADGSFVLRIDYSGEPDGGVVIGARRLSSLGRWLWRWCGPDAEVF